MYNYFKSRDKMFHYFYVPNIPHILIYIFYSSNSRSEPFNMSSILKCARRPNFIFFWIFLLFIKYFTKLLFFSGPELSKSNSFVKYLINSKQIPKKKYLVSKHILIWRSCWTVRIDCLNFENKNMANAFMGTFFIKYA